MREAITFIENHLFDDFNAEDVAAKVNISSFYFQKGFKIMTGYSVAEYLRNRRLYLSALDALKGELKIIDIAYKYHYDTPESFTKAFRRFHGSSPMQVRKEPYKIKTFHPLQISISVKGGSMLDYSIERRDSCKMIGIERDFTYDEAFNDIPEFWAEYKKKLAQLCNRELKNCCIGMYGVSIDGKKSEKSFRYLIAGEYHNEIIPEGFKIIEIPSLTFAKFRCTGPMPEAIQAVNTRIFNEWLPGNEEYEISAGYNIEKYSEGDINGIEYKSEIWIPVKTKLKK